jgi:CRISPR-associated protein Csy2
MKTILLLSKIAIHNANALSSPYTIGFPAMTAWLGAVHALQRRLNQGEFSDLTFKSVGVVCHDIRLQTYKGQGDYVYSIIGTGNPLDKTGERPSFIEEARCHLNVSLVIECDGLPFDEEEFLDKLPAYLHVGLKMAGGDLLSFHKPELMDIDSEEKLRDLSRRLMSGHVLIERRELMIEAMQDGQDAIDALLDYLKVEHRSQLLDKAEWTAKRKAQGWIVPIATGFHGISELGIAENQRDPDTQHRFAESVVTLGEFVMPYRIKRLDDMLWHNYYDAENNLYLTQQNNHNVQ